MEKETATSEERRRIPRAGYWSDTLGRREVDGDETRFLDLAQRRRRRRDVERAGDGAERIVQLAEVVLLLALRGAGAVPDLVRERAVLGGEQRKSEEQDPQHGVILPPRELRNEKSLPA